MNNQEAKFILNAYRSSGVDAHDELFAEALRQAQQDPALGEWLALQRAHDAEVARKLKEIAPPPGLREAILTGARVSNVRRPIWRQPLWMTLGAAAAVLLVASLAFWPKPGLAENRRLSDFAIKDTARNPHGAEGEEVEIVRALLSDPRTRLSTGLPVELADFGKVGCRTVYFNGQEVFEVCFNRNGKWYHLYAMRISIPTEGRIATDVAIEKREKFSSATWADPNYGYRYALVGDVSVEELKNLL